MSLVQMTTGIKPCCRSHYQRPMVAVEIYGEIAGEPSSFAAFACEEQGCGQLYNIIHGYFRISAGKIVKDNPQHPCPMDGSMMYLADANPGGGGTSTYRCSQFGCKESRVFKGPVRPK